MIALVHLTILKGALIYFILLKAALKIGRYLGPKFVNPSCGYTPDPRSFSAFFLEKAEEIRGYHPPGET